MDKTKRKLTLVRNKELLYPKDNADHKLLNELGVPVGRIPRDYYPLLKAVVPASVKIFVVSFSDLEATMCENLRAKFQHTVLLSERAITLVYPKTLQEKFLEKAHNALIVWYRSHYIHLLPVPKRSGKTHSLAFRKELHG